MLIIRILVIWLHLLGVACWFGSLLAVTLFQSSELRRIRFGDDGPDIGLENLWQKVRMIGWHSAALIVITGIFNVINVVLARPGAFPMGMIHIVGTKLVLLAAVLAIQLGPVRQANRATVDERNRGKGLIWSIVSLVLASVAVLLGVGLRAY